MVENKLGDIRGFNSAFVVLDPFNHTYNPAKGITSFESPEGKEFVKAVD